MTGRRCSHKTADTKDPRDDIRTMLALGKLSCIAGTEEAGRHQRTMLLKAILWIQGELATPATPKNMHSELWEWQTLKFTLIYFIKGKTMGEENGPAPVCNRNYRGPCFKFKGLSKEFPFGFSVCSNTQEHRILLLGPSLQQWFCSSTWTTWGVFCLLHITAFH